MLLNRLSLYICALLAASPALGQTEILLWPDLKVEGEKTVVERGTLKLPNRAVSGAFAPTLTTYLPTKNPTGASVILCPGGGYRGLAIDLHGHEIARWLQERGVAALILQYRLPKGDTTLESDPLPFQDARRALQLTRENAAKWNLRTDRIGLLGFSAGGHLAASVSTHFEVEEKPNFLILVSPVISMREELQNRGTRMALLGNNPDQHLIERYSAELHVSAQTPPTFIVHAQNDTTAPPAASAIFGAELQKNGVPVTLFLPSDGGHAIQLGMKGEAAAWSQRLGSWMRERGLMATPVARGSASHPTVQVGAARH
jgi:acetyl esterase/lipase